MRGLTARLLIFNLLLAVFPVGAMLFLGTYEAQLLESQERAMVQQGRLLASALKGSNLSEDATTILDRLGTRNDSRLRVVDVEGRLLADSARPKADESTTPDEIIGSVSFPKENLIYRIGAWPTRTIRRITRFVGPPRVSTEEAEYYIGREILDGPEILAALAGRYGAATRISQGQVSVTLYSAIPILRNDAVTGAVLVSRSTYAILTDLYQLRLDIMIIFLFSIGAAVLLSILVARTVTVPVGRLRNQAESLLDERGKLQARFNPLSGRDEVADLSRALHRLSTRLQERTNHLEDFMADLVHEMKNPVAGILSAAELAERTVRGEARRFIDVIDREGRRIQQLLDDLKELISVDVRLDKGHQGPVDIVDLMKTLASSYPRHPREDVTVELADVRDGPVFINADAHRLTQAILNLVDNAVSFSPENGRVELKLDTEGRRVAIHVADQGPGIVEADSEKIFERWYTDRPEEETANHTGLGLAIVRGIATGYGGRVYSQGPKHAGAEFVLEFPRSRG